MFDKIRPLIFKLDPELAHKLAIKQIYSLINTTI